MSNGRCARHPSSRRSQLTYSRPNVRFNVLTHKVKEKVASIEGEQKKRVLLTKWKTNRRQLKQFLTCEQKGDKRVVNKRSNSRQRYFSEKNKALSGERYGRRKLWNLLFIFRELDNFLCTVQK